MGNTCMKTQYADAQGGGLYMGGPNSILTLISCDVYNNAVYPDRRSGSRVSVATLSGPHGNRNRALLLGNTMQGSSIEHFFLGTPCRAQTFMHKVEQS